MKYTHKGPYSDVRNASETVKNRNNIITQNTKQMQNLLNFNFKSIVQSKARWLLTLIAILTLGVGQMWGV